MKAVFSTLFLVFLIATASGEDALMDGGRSPDGRYEVRIEHLVSNDPDGSPDGYSIQLFVSGKAKPFYTLDSVGSYLRYATAIDRGRALWHGSSEFVVITDQATKHSKEIYILAISNERVERLKVPDYAQNALGRVDATEVDLHCISTPKGWEGDDLVLTFYFSVRGRYFYTSEVTLHLSHGPHNAPSVGLKKVTAPTEQKG